MVKLFSKNSNLCDHNSPTLQTDRQTDGRTDGQTTCDRNAALCTKVHRAVKTTELGKIEIAQSFSKGCYTPGQYGNEFQIFITRFEKKISITCRTTVRLFELNTVASGKPAVRECKK